MREYFDLLRRNRNYRYLWLGSVVSQLGDWFNLIASAEIITNMTNSGVAISYLFLARFLPLFLFSPLAGVLADRYSRRRIMIVSDLLRALTVLGFLFVQATGQIWLFYALTVMQFILSALFTPARSAVLSNVVEKDELVAANALDSLTWSTMLALGAFLGGVVAAVLGAEAAFILDALTFLLSAWFISRIVMAATDRKKIVQASSGWFDFVDGFRYLWHEPFILGIALVKAVGSLVWGGINVLEITFAQEVFPFESLGLGDVLPVEDGGTAMLGLVYVVSGVGTGLGPIFMRRLLGDRFGRVMKGIGVGFVLLPIGILMIAFSTLFAGFLTGTLIRTVGSGTVWVFSAAMLQRIVPDKYRGRVFAFEFAALTLTQSISTFLAGVWQDAWGVRQATAVFGLLGLIAALLWFVFYAYSQKQSRNHRAGWVVSGVE
ncbi:MAG: MFS transporter [Anaerolineae bacterium]|nr:MFS transporter [Anaerolineae bacterium]